jgi:hypothetical protein
LTKLAFTAVQLTAFNSQPLIQLTFLDDALEQANRQGLRVYQLPRKTEVAEVYLELCEEQAHPSVNKTAKLSKVSWRFANLVIAKLKAIGQLWILN